MGEFSAGSGDTIKNVKDRETAGLFLNLSCRKIITSYMYVPRNSSEC